MLLFHLLDGELALLGVNEGRALVPGVSSLLHLTHMAWRLLVLEHV